MGITGNRKQVVIEDIPKIFSERLNSLRERNREKRIESADGIGISFKAYEGIINKGKTKPTIQTVSKAANHYDVSLDYLVGASDYTQIGNKELSVITGLSDKAIRKIKKMDEEQILLLNKFIENGLFKTFVNAIHDYFFNLGTDIELNGVSKKYTEGINDAACMNRVGECVRSLRSNKAVYNFMIKQRSISEINRLPLGNNEYERYRSELKKQITQSDPYNEMVSNARWQSATQ